MGAPSVRRTLLVGFDGGTWELLRPASASGLLPNVARFLAGSVRAPLASVHPPVTIPAWYSAVTGASPATLDAWGFTAPGDRPGAMRMVWSYRPREALWDLLGRRGWRTGVVNFPAVPAPPVHGYFVSGMLEPAGRCMTYPAELSARLVEGPQPPWQFDLGGTGRGRLPLAQASLEQKARLVERLEGEGSSDLLFVLFSETDRVQHDLYDDLLRSTSGAAVPPGIAAYWRALDDAFERVRQAFHRGSEGITVLFSDHGFGTTSGFFHTNRFLLREGFLRTRPGVREGWRPRLTDLAVALDRFLPLAPLLRSRARAPAEGPGPAGPPGTAPRETGDARLPGPDGGPRDRTFGWFSQFVDWERTRAVSFPIPEGIYANPFRPGPPLGPQERRELRKEIVAALKRFPHVRIDTVDPEAEYGRPLGPRAPLLLVYAQGMAWETHGDMNHARTFLPRRASFVRRQGTHRREGIIAVAAPGVPPRELEGPMPLLAFAPTLLRLLGIAAPPMEAPPYAPLLAACGVAPPREPAPRGGGGPD